ncbi:hypothetical protein [Pseudomonas frederiksbergensis]|uniref:hypothetical protein n=1 Tax=Pseudomonas frederiksbergensis TaxID=104087 RepID=UPI003D2004D5
MRKNFRHLKRCLKRHKKIVRIDVFMPKKALLERFHQNAAKKNPEPVGVFY